MPASLPLYWRDETTGILARAVESYLADQTGGRASTAEEIRLVCKYLDQWICAPCWTRGLIVAGENDPELTAEFVKLRADVKTIRTADEVHDWLMRAALDLGIDPL